MDALLHEIKLDEDDQSKPAKKAVESPAKSTQASNAAGKTKKKCTALYVGGTGSPRGYCDKTVSKAYEHCLLNCRSESVFVALAMHSAARAATSGL